MSSQPTTPRDAGYSLRKTREKLCLRYRDVEEASQLIAKRRGSPDFIIGLSRLSDIENRGTVPSIFRIYSISTIYGLNFSEILSWYGVDMTLFPQDAMAVKVKTTRRIGLDFLPEHTLVDAPLDLDSMLDLRKTTYISRQIKLWGKLPLSFLQALEPAGKRYALVGTDDWSMYPLIVPGSFVQIDETKRRIVNTGWSDEYSRPIYFIEHRNGFRCCWCSERRGTLITQPHSSSTAAAEVFDFPGNAEVIGQVVAVAMRLDLEQPHRRRSSTNPK